MRSLAKSFVEAALVGSGYASFLRRSKRDQTLILAYHNIVSDDDTRQGDQSLHLTQSSFSRQLDCLMKTHEIICMRDFLALRQAPSDTSGSSSKKGSRPSPKAVITFDDAYRGSLTAGMEELVKRNLPATVFVTPGYLGDKAFWWDLMTPQGEAGMPDAVRNMYLNDMQGMGDRIIDDGRSISGNDSGMAPAGRSVHVEELRDTLNTYHHLTVGSHTWSHANLKALPPKLLKSELKESKDWLESHVPDRFLPVISYPYGLADSRVWHSVEETGYTHGFMIDGGWAETSVDRSVQSEFFLPRLNVPSEVTRNGFILRTSGIINR